MSSPIHTVDAWYMVQDEDAYAGGESGSAYAKTVLTTTTSRYAIDIPKGEQEMPETPNSLEVSKVVGQNKFERHRFKKGFNYQDGSLVSYMQSLYFAKKAVSGTAGGLPDSFMMHHYNGDISKEHFGLLVQEWTMSLVPNEDVEQSISTFHFDTTRTGLTVDGSTASVDFSTEIPKIFSDFTILAVKDVLDKDPTFHTVTAASTSGTYWTTGANWTIANSKATHATGSAATLSQAFAAPGADTTVVIHVSGLHDAETLTIEIAGDAASATISTNGVSTVTVTSSTNNATGIVITPTSTFIGVINQCYVYKTANVLDLDVKELTPTITLDLQEDGYEIGTDGRKYPLIKSVDGSIELTFWSKETNFFASAYESTLFPWQTGTSHTFLLYTSDGWLIGFNSLFIDEPPDRNIVEFGIFEYTTTLSGKDVQFSIGVNDEGD